MSVIDFFPQSLECDKKSLAKILQRIPVPPQGKEKAIEMAPEPATFSLCFLSNTFASALYQLLPCF
jgi:hypothetical protein